MKDKLKKLTIFIIAICILFMSSSATYGATVENNTTQMYSLTTMEYQGQIIEIPVLTQTTMSKLRNSVFTSEVYVFIPDMTEETMEKNEEYVKEIKRTGNCSAMRQARSIYFGLPGYIAYHSTLNYNVSYYKAICGFMNLISFSWNEKFTRKHHLEIFIMRLQRHFKLEPLVIRENLKYCKTSKKNTEKLNMIHYIQYLQNGCQ